MPIASSGRERLANLVAGHLPDRPPVSFWRHFYTEENDPHSLAEAMLRFQREFDWDWIKLNPRASYHLEDWGYHYEPSRDALTKPTPTHYPVAAVQDWARIEPLDPNAGVLAEHLKALRAVVAGAGGIPVLMTVFTPLSIAGDLVADDRVLLEHLRTAPRAVETALEAITQTFERFADEILHAGADGLFFATTQWASRKLLTPEEYHRWGRPYDLRVLSRAGNASFNLLHVCHEQALLAELSDYPVAFFNWGFADPGNPDLESGHKLVGKPVVGGVTRKEDLLTSNAEDLYAKVRELTQRLAGTPWVCGPDCSIYPQSRVENLRAVRQALNEDVDGV
jgi:uroporphyrinogen decarboxylase